MKNQVNYSTPKIWNLQGNMPFEYKVGNDFQYKTMAWYNICVILLPFISRLLLILFCAVRELLHEHGIDRIVSRGISFSINKCVLVQDLVFIKSGLIYINFNFPNFYDGIESCKIPLITKHKLHKKKFQPHPGILSYLAISVP